MSHDYFHFGGPLQVRLQASQNHLPIEISTITLSQPTLKDEIHGKDEAARNSRPRQGSAGPQMFDYADRFDWLPIATTSALVLNPSR